MCVLAQFSTPFHTHTHIVTPRPSHIHTHLYTLTFTPSHTPQVVKVSREHKKTVVAALLAQHEPRRAIVFLSSKSEQKCIIFRRLLINYYYELGFELDRRLEYLCHARHYLFAKICPCKKKFEAISTNSSENVRLLNSIKFLKLRWKNSFSLAHKMLTFQYFITAHCVAVCLLIMSLSCDLCRRHWFHGTLPEIKRSEGFCNEL